MASAIEFFRVIYLNLIFMTRLDFGNVKFEQDFIVPVSVGVALLSLFVLKMVTGRNKSSFEGSGHFLSSSIRGITEMILGFVAVLSFSSGLVSVLAALTGPYVLRTDEIKTIKGFTERMEAVDASVSMGWPFQDSGVSLAEVAREEHLKFLKMREGKNDRVALWLFSAGYQRIEDFISDDSLYRMQVVDAPYVFADPNHQCLPKSLSDPKDVCLDIVVPEERIHKARGEGGTNLVGVLNGIIEYFDRNRSRDSKRRGLLILTDAAVDAYPETQFAALKRRNIRPYIIYLDNTAIYSRSTEAIDRERLENVARMKKEIEMYGGKYFDVRDKDSIRRAYEEINKLESIREEVTNRSIKISLFQNFLLLALPLMFIGILAGLTSKVFGTYP